MTQSNADKSGGGGGGKGGGNERRQMTAAAMARAEASSERKPHTTPSGWTVLLGVVIPEWGHPQVGASPSGGIPSALVGVRHVDQVVDLALDPAMGDEPHG